MLLNILFKFFLTLYQLIKIQIGIIKVVNNKKKEIPSTPTVKFKFK